MICRRITEIKPFIVMDVLEKAQEMERSGASIVHLEVGEPDFATPAAVVEAGIAALRRGETHYTHSLGIAPLREAICAHYRDHYGVSRLEPDQVLVTSGTSPAFLVALSALIACGDEVLLSDPHYACYPNFIRFLEGVPRLIPAQEQDGFQFRPEAIRAALTPAVKVILVNSPANPTGTLLAPECLAAIADCGRWVLSDEIYHGLVYQGRAHSMLEYTDRCIVLNGFSKLYAMTGWRIGYLIVPPDLVRPLQALMQNFFISANAAGQWAALTALTDPSVAEEVARMRGIYDQRRRFMIDRLRQLGFGIGVEPTGAFYVFANARRFTDKSYDFAFEVLREARVGVTPGIDFGSNGEGYIRFSYANSLEHIEEGLNRLGAYLERRGQ